jgi:hypothetical protein
MRTAIVAMLAASGILLSAGSASAAPPTDIKAYCASKWAEYTMQAYCIEREELAQRKLGAGVSDQQIWARCYQKWDAWTMVAYCVEQEEKAKAKVLGTPAPPPRVAPPASVPAPPPSSGGARQSSARHPCVLYADLLYYDRDGTLSAKGFRDSFRQIYEWAKAFGDPKFTEAAGELWKAGVLKQDYGEYFGGPARDIAQLRPRIAKPMAKMTELCTPEPAFQEARRDRSGSPIAGEEAERQLKGGP